MTEISMVVAQAEECLSELYDLVFPGRLSEDADELSLEAQGPETELFTDICRVSMNKTIKLF